jgi:RNA polymerase sigma-70 factor, ECF subfamily
MAAAFDLVVPSIAELYREHHAHVRAFARRLLRDEASAEDLVQETFLALPTALRAYRGDSPLRSFVLGVAANHARHHVRARARRQAAHERSGEVDIVPPSTPQDRAERKELAESLTRALDQLPEDQRAALVLCEVEEHSAAEAARIVGAKEATIRTRVFHAKKKLRAILFVTMTFVISAAWAAYPSLVSPPSPPVIVPVPVPVPAPVPDLAPAPTTPAPVPVETSPVELLPDAPKPLVAPPTPQPKPKPTSQIDHETPLYEAAHEAHFVARDPARALAAWDAYLAAHPSGRFAPEAKYNRALSLLRLGRKDEAKDALAPFADGAHGDYRKREAKKLLDTLR